MIKVQNIYKKFSKKEEDVLVLDNINLQVPHGRFMAFVGPSGCGKSTLLNLIAGLIKPTLGEIHYDGRLLNGVNTQVGYLTQDDTLFPWKTTADNIAVPLEIKGVPRGEREEKIRDIMSMMNLTGFEKHYPAELSGGMRKRAALARTLIYDPETLLMDEPFGALDAQLKLILQDELIRLWDGSQKTIIFVTHDLAEAISLADQVVVFTGRPARIKTIEDIDLKRPRDVFHIRFDPKFGEIYEYLWNALKDEIRKGEEV